MNQELLQWLIGGLCVLGLAYGGGGIGAYVSIVQRLAKLETAFAMLGEKAAKVLHSPHTPKLDALLEKYVDRNYELKPAEWEELLQMCDDIENDVKKPKEQRALAAIVSTVCHHKLFHLPPKIRKHH